MPIEIIYPNSPSSIVQPEYDAGGYKGGKPQKVYSTPEGASWDPWGNHPIELQTKIQFDDGRVLRVISEEEAQELRLNWMKETNTPCICP